MDGDILVSTGQMMRAFTEWDWSRSQMKDGSTAGLNYFSAPDAAMESPAEMRPWAQRALDAALQARAAKAPKRASKNASGSR